MACGDRGAFVAPEGRIRGVKVIERTVVGATDEVGPRQHLEYLVRALLLQDLLQLLGQVVDLVALLDFDVFQLGMDRAYSDVG